MFERDGRYGFEHHGNCLSLEIVASIFVQAQHVVTQMVPDICNGFWGFNRVYRK
jgi:hypothetical protein